MALISPRFRSDSKFGQIDSNTLAFRHGARGREVHIVQMALVDLGIVMPRSTANQHYGPDGIYGSETVDAVKRFQRETPGLIDDGVFGQKTLRALDARHNRFAHRINLHFRSLSLTNVPFDRMMASTERVYAQYSIQAFFASGESMGLSDAEQQRFNTVRQNCEWDMNSGEFADLHRRGSPVPQSDIKVFIVNRFQETNVLGCGGHASNRPACAVTHNCSRWDVAHEVGHVLLTSRFPLIHSSDRRNLMFEFSSNGSESLTLTDRQLRQMRSNPLCRAI